MNCKEIQQQTFEYLEGTLAIEKAQVFEQHIISCSACKQYLQEAQLMLATLDEVELAVPSESLHHSFTEMLAQEKKLAAKPVASRVVPLYWKTAFQVAASVVLLMGGYMMGTYFANSQNASEVMALQQQKEVLKTEMTLALLENRSASKRIQAVNYSEEITEPDSKLLQAIIDRLFLDGNVNVRLTAAEALSKFSESNQVKEAFITVLATEKNPEIQIAVIHYLVRVQEKRAIAPMQELLKEPEVPIFVKNQLDKGVQQLL